MYSILIRITKIWLTVCSGLLKNLKLWDCTCSLLERQASTMKMTAGKDKFNKSNVRVVREALLMERGKLNLYKIKVGILELKT